MSTYRDELVKAMNKLAEDPKVVFCGYNVCPTGGSAGGSLSQVPEAQRQEFPLAENLLMGASIGLSLDGFIPMAWIERADFLYCCMDALVNHINFLSTLSQGQHNPGVIIRVCIGNSKAPLFTGPTHTQDPYEAMLKLVQFQVLKIQKIGNIETFYRWALESAKKGKSTMIIEEKDRYNET